MDCSPPVSLSMGFPRQEYWSGLLFPSPGDLLDPRIKPESPDWQVDSLPLNHLGSPLDAEGNTTEGTHIDTYNETEKHTMRQRHTNTLREPNT